MSKTQKSAGNGGQITGKFAVELKNLELELQQQLAKTALSVEKSTTSVLSNAEKSLESVAKLKETFAGKLEALVEEFGVESVTIKQRIQELRDQEAEAEDSLATKKELCDEEKNNFVKTHDETMQELKDKAQRDVEEFKYDLNKQIREEGEEACSGFLEDRGLVTIEEVKLNDLESYKKTSESEVEGRIQKAVDEAVVEMDRENAHEKEVVDLKHANEVSLFETRIAEKDKLVHEIRGLLTSNKKKDENFYAEIRSIVEAASRTVTNTIQQMPAQ